MPKIITDRFSLPQLSRQRRYQLRREAAGCCRICGAKGAPYCEKHLARQRELGRNRPKPVARRVTPDPQDII